MPDTPVNSTRESAASVRYATPNDVPDWNKRMRLCLDCGALVFDQETHTRFHSVLSSHGWVLAVLKTTHLAPHIHDRYDSTERIDGKRFDNWSADALAEVIEGHGNAT